jgi:hypothetical protein
MPVGRYPAAVAASESRRACNLKLRVRHCVVSIQFPVATRRSPALHWQLLQRAGLPVGPAAHRDRDAGGGLRVADSQKATVAPRMSDTTARDGQGPLPVALWYR